LGIRYHVKFVLVQVVAVPFDRVVQNTATTSEILCGICIIIMSINTETQTNDKYML
jgi:hypothetical protein